MPQKIILLLILVFVFNNLSCSVSEPDAEHMPLDTKPASGDALVRLIHAEPGILNPILSTDVYSSDIESLMFDSLIERDPQTLEFRPLCAEKWEISRDGMEYTFSLRKGIKWDDGREMTAKDVLFSFNMIKDPSVNAPHLRNYYNDIQSVEVIGAYTVKFKYIRKYFRALEICGTMPILPEHIYNSGDFNESGLNRRPAGNGPYSFDKWKTGSEIVIKRNKNYWGDKPFIDKIIFKIITDETVALQLLKKGEIDMMSLQPLQWEKQTGAEKFLRRYDKHKYFLPNYSFIAWNLQKEPFCDVRVRQAMTHFINRKKILDKLRYGLGVIVTGPFYVNSDEYDKTVLPLEYSPSKARQLLAETGWKDTDGDGIMDKNGKKFEFEFLIPSGTDFSSKLATIIKEDFAKEGIIVEIKNLEWAVFVQNLNERNFDAVTLAWQMPVESDPYQVWHSSQAGKGSNFIGFRNDKADFLIEAIRETLDKKRRIEYCHEFHRMLNELQPYTFLFCSNSLVALNKRFMNVKVYPMGFRIIEWYVPGSMQLYSE
ncbi:peptide-binding protein [bacterium]|jgi:peptide/nickel transport system substrate-binding protein|nr:peptide-binding protein [bacterium]